MKRSQHEQTYRIALEGLLVALMLVLGFVESLIPVPVPVPGIKLGLSNGVLIAREIEREEGKDRDGSGFEVEGRITAIDTAAATLVLRGLVIRYANARFEDGTRDQLRVGVKIDVKGRLASDGTSLDAVEIEFED